MVFNCYRKYHASLCLVGLENFAVNFKIIVCALYAKMVQEKAAGKDQSVRALCDIVFGKSYPRYWFRLINIQLWRTTKDFVGKGF